MPCSPTDCTEVPCRYMKDAIANRNNRDPEAIRRECADRAIAYMTDDGTYPAEAWDPLRAAILSAEPAQLSCKTCIYSCRGICEAEKGEDCFQDGYKNYRPAQDDRLKPSNYDDENPCASCLADDPSGCEKCETTDPEHVDSEWKPKPAQDDGKPDAFASAIVKELRVNWAFDTDDALSVLNGAKRRL